MPLIKKFSFYFLAISLTLGVASCSDDDDNGSSGPSTPPGSEFGSVNLTLSGDVEGERSGNADFQLLDLAGIVQLWSFSMYDYSPQTFTLDFDYSVDSIGAPQPGPGTYTIGPDMNNPEAKYFTAHLTLIENEDYENAVEYNAGLFDSGGTITITSSNDQEIEGSFSFTGEERDDLFNVISTVDVTGDFTAVDYQ